MNEPKTKTIKVGRLSGRSDLEAMSLLAPLVAANFCDEHSQHASLDSVVTGDVATISACCEPLLQRATVSVESMSQSLDTLDVAARPPFIVPDVR